MLNMYKSNLMFSTFSDKLGFLWEHSEPGEKRTGIVLESFMMEQTENVRQYLEKENVLMYEHTVYVSQLTIRLFLK